MCEINNILNELSDLQIDKYSFINQFRKLISDYLQESNFDDFFNVIGRNAGTKKKIALCCKADTPEFIVNNIDKSGIIEAIPTEIVNYSNLILQEVIIYGTSSIEGIISSVSNISITNRREKKIYIDSGMKYDELNKILNKGDSISLKQKFSILNNGSAIFNSKNSMFTLLAFVEIIRELYKQNIDIDISYIIFSHWQGLYHALNERENTSLKPELLIILDTSLPMKRINISKGPIIYKNPYISFEYFEKLQKVSKTNKIPYQMEVQGSGKNMNRKNIIGVSNMGIPIVQVDIPLEYNYSTIAKSTSKDLLCTIELITKFLLDINAD